MIVSREEISGLSAELKSQNKKIVFTNGCFDIIHAGHVTYLAEAKDLGDILIVGLNTDDSVKMLKGEGRPVNCEQDRAVVLNALKPVDIVVAFDEDTPFELIKSIMPNVLVKGGDYTFDTIVGSDFVSANGGDVVVIPLVEGKSTTAVIKKLKGKKQ